MEAREKGQSPPSPPDLGLIGARLRERPSGSRPLPSSRGLLEPVQICHDSLSSDGPPSSPLPTHTASPLRSPPHSALWCARSRKGGLLLLPGDPAQARSRARRAWSASKRGQHKEAIHGLQQPACATPRWGSSGAGRGGGRGVSSRSPPPHLQAKPAPALLGFRSAAGDLSEAQSSQGVFKVGVSRDPRRLIIPPSAKFFPPAWSGVLFSPLTRPWVGVPQDGF